MTLYVVNHCYDPDDGRRSRSVGTVEADSAPEALLKAFDLWPDLPRHGRPQRGLFVRPAPSSTSSKKG